MKITTVLLLVAGCANAVVDFGTSQLIDEWDVNKNNQGVPFVCPGSGCTVYTTRMSSLLSDNIGIYNGDQQLTTLGKIYQKTFDGFLVGYHLSGGANYKLKKNREFVDVFKVWIVADSAGNGAVTDFWDYLDLEMILYPSGNRVVTVLGNTGNGLSFSKYKGTAAPRIYAAGYDAVGKCKTVYTARTPQNAADSYISLQSNLATVDFGSTDNTNRYSVNKYAVYYVRADIGESVIVMSPGYTGCPLANNYYNSMLTLPQGIENIRPYDERWRADVYFNDMNMANGHELTLRVTGYNDVKVGGYQPQTYSFVAQHLSVDLFPNTRMDGNDYFCAQIDISNGVSGTFALFSILAIIVVLL